MQLGGDARALEGGAMALDKVVRSVGPGGGPQVRHARVDGEEDVRVAIEVGQALVRGPVVETLHGCRVFSRLKHRAHHLLQQAGGEAPRLQVPHHIRHHPKLWQITLESLTSNREAGAPWRLRFERVMMKSGCSGGQPVVGPAPASTRHNATTVYEQGVHLPQAYLPPINLF